MAYYSYKTDNNRDLSEMRTMKLNKEGGNKISLRNFDKKRRVFSEEDIDIEYVKIKREVIDNKGKVVM